ncbi:hypothetical protein GXW82_32535 [Streptacidiphilus sp. 4-A2]|nr:hypothetical protein [Streptacidiphilus sp. 4-A2]
MAEMVRFASPLPPTMPSCRLLASFTPRVTVTSSGACGIRWTVRCTAWSAGTSGWSTSSSVRPALVIASAARPTGASGSRTPGKDSS